MRRRSSAEVLGGVGAGFLATLAVASALPARTAGVPDVEGGTAPAAATGAATVPVPPAARAVTLSHPGRVSRYAFVEHATTVRSAPSTRARHLGRLTTRTDDGTSELVLVVTRSADGRWLRVRTPLRPAGRTGWVRAAWLSPARVVHTALLVDRASRRLRLIRDGRTVFSARVAVGAPGTPTPAGRFYVRDHLTGLDPDGIYGPTAFGTSAHSATVTDWPGGAVVGIHGTDEPGLIGRDVSHGCIRLRNQDIVRLARLMPVGTPITIR